MSILPVPPSSPEDQPATKPEEEDRILLEAVNFYQERVEEEAYKAKHSREGGALQREVDQLAAALNVMYKVPSRHRAQIAETEKLFEEKMRKLETLGLVPRQAQDYRLV